MMLMPTVEEMYRALVERDASFEGLFFACVRTTGVFCRPTCTARKPKPENVEFVPTVQEALRRGFRPCRVCNPATPAAGETPWLAPLLRDVERSEGRLRDEDLRERGLDAAEVRRTFKRRFGMTFQAYQRTWRLGGALRAIRGGVPVIEAGFDAGFESESGFREAFARVFGTSPGRADQPAVLSMRIVETPLGPMAALAGDEGLELLEFVDRRALERELMALRRRFPGPVVPGTSPVLEAAAAQLREYFDGRRQTFDLPLRVRGSGFQAAVWRALCTIPYGTTVSYLDIARRVGAPGAVRAVGLANGRNQIAIVIPCHRVIRADGTLCGYGGGRWRKQWLLDHERRHAGVRPAGSAI